MTRADEHVSALTDVLSGKKRGVLLHTERHTPDAQSFLFTNPNDRIVAKSLSEVLPAIAHLERAIAAGKYVAGFMSYEAGYAFEPAFGRAPRFHMTFPLLQFGVFDAPIVFRDTSLARRNKAHTSAYWIQKGRYSQNRKAYTRTFDAIKEYIAAGDVYQINHCFDLSGKFFGSAGALFCDLLAEQRVSYAAYINLGSQHIVSLSPELFFTLDGRALTMKPMKGTLIKSADLIRDNARLKQFERSSKNQAENLMIVDLIRNDASRVSHPHSVRVPHLYTIEEYETLYQMTSTITSTICNSTRFIDICSALFPCGSVTGAPKIRAMEIIREQENARGPYTGAIGYVAPHMEAAAFNIPIRTVCIDSKKKRYSMGVGSGIVADSNAQDEFNECCGKAAFLTKVMQRYSLIETLLYERKKGYFLKDLHLERLMRSARFFDIPLDLKSIQHVLRDLRGTLTTASRHRVRLLINARGVCSTTCTPLPENCDTQKPIHVCLHPTPIDETNVFLRHKTTNRRLYDAAFRKAQSKGYADTLFFNKKGHLAEGAISNVFIQSGNTYFTPRIVDGALPGVYRAHLLKKYPARYREKLLRLEDLFTADALHLCNSLRGFYTVTLSGNSAARKREEVQRG